MFSTSYREVNVFKHYGGDSEPYCQQNKGLTEPKQPEEKQPALGQS